MSREVPTYKRLICDGCGEAVLEANDLDRAAEDHGWSVSKVGAWELCPICRPDSIIEGLRERVTQLEAKLAGFDTAY